MNIIKHNEPKSRTEYKRNYDGNERLKDIDVSRSELEELAGVHHIWNKIKWLNEKNMYDARFDITLGMIATLVAKQILTGEEKKWAEELGVKENRFLSKDTYNHLTHYIWDWYENFKNQGLIEYRIVPQRKVYVKGNYKRSYNDMTVSARLTPKGENFDM